MTTKDPNRREIRDTILKTNRLLQSLGNDHSQNITRLVTHCGETTGAESAFYLRLEHSRLNLIAGWNLTAQDLSLDANPGSPGAILIDQSGPEAILHTDLQTWPEVTSLNNKGVFSLLAKAVMTDGSPAGLLCALFPHTNPPTLPQEHAITAVACAIANEEARLHAAQKLEESESRFRSAFLTSPDSININRMSDGLYVDINEGFSKITGYTRDEVIGKTSLELNVWENPADRALMIDSLKRFGYVENLEARYRMKNGTVKTGFMSARIFMIRNEPHILSVTRDMTEWKKTMLALEGSELRFRSVVENAFDGIYLINSNRFIYTNNRFCEIMGYSAEEIASDDFDFGITLTDKSRYFIEKRREARLRGESIPGIYEFEIQTKSGEIKEVEVSTVMIGNADELTVLGIMRDVTDRKKLFEELIHARDKAEEVNILKSRLLANLSHEIRTPLNGILGFAELLQEDLTNESQKSMAEIISSSGYRLLNTLNSILDLSVIESQFGKINLNTVSLNKLALESVNLFRPLAQKKGITINIREDHPGAYVRADEEMVNKILNNLINNAIKFTHEGGITVTVTLLNDAQQPTGCISVADTGIGIKKEYLEIIFDEFRQVSEGQTRQYDGSGLGLHISRRFAEMMGGAITVTSQVDVGSEFTLSLPLK